MAKENNIAFKLDENILVTKDGNYVLELRSKEFLIPNFFRRRNILSSKPNTIFGKISSDIEINLIVKKIELN